MTAMIDEPRRTGSDWLDSWDRQQEGYVPARDDRAAMMFEVIERLRGRTPRVLDLACGPGSLTRMLLARMPEADVVAVDLDPVLLALGQWALGDGDGHITWVDADLRQPGWARHLSGPFDAVMSTTALHWLAPGQLTEVFRSAFELLVPGGAFVNGDHIDYPHHEPTFRRLAQNAWTAWTDAHVVEDYGSWHEALRQARPDWPWDERDRRFADRPEPDPEPGVGLHLGGLADAGFTEVDTVWQQWNQRVEVAIKPG